MIMLVFPEMEPDEKPIESNRANAANSHLSASEPQIAVEKVDVSKLTPEEQMALFEKELKDSDWGHQPC